MASNAASPMASSNASLRAPEQTNLQKPLSTASITASECETEPEGYEVMTKSQALAALRAFQCSGVVKLELMSRENKEFAYVVAEGNATFGDAEGAGDGDCEEGDERFALLVQSIEDAWQFLEDLEDFKMRTREMTLQCAHLQAARMEEDDDEIASDSTESA